MAKSDDKMCASMHILTSKRYVYNFIKRYPNDVNYEFDVKPVNVIENPVSYSGKMQKTKTSVSAYSKENPLNDVYTHRSFADGTVTFPLGSSSGALRISKTQRKFTYII